MPNAAEILIDTLVEWDVDVVFGLPGDGINGIMEALRTRQDRIRFIQVRHEESAAFMACAYAKWTGRLGVCLATSGPGGTHLLTGLYDAKLDQAPVLAITGMQFHDLIETFTQQDVDLTKVFNDVTIFNAHVADASHMENVASLACRSALSGHGVAHLSIANDVQEQELEDAERSKRNRPNHVPNRMVEGRRLPAEAELDTAAHILNDASKVAILVGRGALGARDELERTAELLTAPIAKALLGKPVLPDDHPYTTGGIGILGTLPSPRLRGYFAPRDRELVGTPLTMRRSGNERDLIDHAATLPLQPLQFGQYEGRRRVASSGWQYDYSQRRLLSPEPIPGWLAPLIEQVGAIGDPGSQRSRPRAGR